ncbi:hypothetical protein ACFFRE_12410, partial [Aciditerrimonas ferrireducens]
ASAAAEQGPAAAEQASAAAAASPGATGHGPTAPDGVPGTAGTSEDGTSVGVEGATSPVSEPANEEN